VEDFTRTVLPQLPLINVAFPLTKCLMNGQSQFLPPSLCFNVMKYVHGHLAFVSNSSVQHCRSEFMLSRLCLRQPKCLWALQINFNRHWFESSQGLLFSLPFFCLFRFSSSSFFFKAIIYFSYISTKVRPSNRVRKKIKNYAGIFRHITRKNMLITRKTR